MENFLHIDDLICASPASLRCHQSFLQAVTSIEISGLIYRVQVDGPPTPTSYLTANGSFQFQFQFQFLEVPNSNNPLPLSASWRSMTALISSILIKAEGTTIIDRIIARLRCNQRMNGLDLNASFACSLDLIYYLLMRSLSGFPSSGYQEALVMYFFYRVTRPWQPQPSVCGINDAFLYFVLPFVSAESGPTKLTGLLRQRPLPQPLANDPTMEVSIKSMSPWSLNFELKPPEGRGQSFSHNLLLNIPPKGLPYYQLLVELEPDIGPLIARLAFHLIDVAATTCVSTVSMLNPHVGTFATAKALASSVFMADRHQIPHAPNVNKV